MSKLSVDQLKQVMRAYRIDQPWIDYIEDTKQYLRRMTTLPPGSPAFNAELDRLLDTSTRQGALMVSRYTERSASWMRVAADNPKQQFIRITDEEENEDGQVVLCDVCAEKAGLEGTLADHAAAGLPGTDCLGGNRCRCELVPINY
jgi:hypothetical protein